MQFFVNPCIIAVFKRRNCLLIRYSEWIEREEKHFKAVVPYADAFIERQSLQKKHPVHDFLFTYYTCSPQKLSQWVPSFEETLELCAGWKEKYTWFNDYWFEFNDETLTLNKKRIPNHLIGLTQFVRDLCENIQKRTSKFGCFGLHEWAMVYKSSQDEVRHNGFKLRLSPEELASFVESQTLCCSHYDAFRFFTPSAKPLNLLDPTLNTRLEMEQGGCVHANMDIYKWATKLWPWIGSDFIGKAFIAALRGRELDMKASPYDLTDLGYEPIRIETEEGRKLYQKEQQKYSEEIEPLRGELKEFCEKLLCTF